MRAGVTEASKPYLVTLALALTNLVEQPVQGRYRGDTGEMQGRYSGDTAEIQRRYRGDTGEIQGRYAAGLERGA